jgi:hypothetical protein
MTTHDTIVISDNLSLEITSPMLLEKDPETLRFNLLLLKDGAGFMQVPGFRVWKRTIQAPSTKGYGNKYYPVVQIIDTNFNQALLEGLTSEWKGRYPHVAWPR